MKKVLFVLLALALVGGFVFAQDEEAKPAPKVVFTGGVYTGAVLTFVDGADSPTLRDNHWDEGNGTRFKFNGAYTDGNYGLNFSFNVHLVHDTSVITDYPFLELGNKPELGWGSTYVWANFVNDIIRISAGNLDTVWNNDIRWDSFDYRDGLRLEIKPVIGPGNLDIGFTLPLYTPYQIGGKDVDVPVSADNGPLDDTFPALWNTAFGVKYDISGTFKAVTALQLWPAGKKNPDLLFGVYLGDTVPVAGLKISVEGKIAGLGADKTTTALLERFAFSDKLIPLPGFAAFIGAHQTFETGKDNFKLRIEGQVSYKITPEITGYLYSYFESFTDFDGSLFFIRPRVTFAIGPKATFGAQWAGSFYSDKTGATLTGTTKNEIALIYGWSFE
ncbi:hypothetical protein FACS1894151_07110 [Spirochaetia bacterium]|nr:hypothetical protein FACS1894151_07110 [Spirochaetia bacterium]